MIRKPSSVAASTDEPRSRVRISRVSIPVPAISSAFPSRLPVAGQIAAVTVPNVLAMTGL